MHKGQFNQNTRFSRHIVMITNYTTMNNRKICKIWSGNNNSTTLIIIFDTA